MSDISLFVDTILSGCIPQDDELITITSCKNNYSKVETFVREDMLRGYQYILYKIISRSYDNGIKIDWKYIQPMYENSAKRFIRDKNVSIKELFPDVKVSELTDKEKERQVIGQLNALLEKKYNDYKSAIVDMPEVNGALDQLKSKMKEEEVKQIMMQASKILFNGDEVMFNGKKTYMYGGDDSLKYSLSELGSVNNKYTDGEGTLNWFHIQSFEDVQNMRNSDSRSYDFSTDTGIPMLDESTGGLFTTQILGVQGMPGVGKSRFASKIMYRAKVLHGKNVMYTSMEQHCNELAMYFVSQHCWYKYGRYITDKQLKLHFVNIKRIDEAKLTDVELAELADETPLDEEEVQIVTEAELDLWSNPNYGQIVLDNSYPPVEGLEAHIRNIHFNHMKIDVLCLDHMSILISDGSWSKGIKLSQTEIVTEAMKLVKRLCQRLNFFVIAINQMTREEINRNLEGKATRITGSANSSEFERSCDIMWNLGETQQLAEVGKCFVDQPKARDSEKSSRVMLDTKKGICVYDQSATQETE